MTSKCVICTSTTQSLVGSSEEQLTLEFFIKRFLKYVVLREDDEDVKDFAESLVTLEYQTERHPANWIWFCPSCFEHVHEAQKLHQVLLDLENKLNSLRIQIEEKVQESFEQAEMVENYNIVFKRVRQAIYRRGSAFPEFSVKVECPSDDFDWPNTPSGTFGETGGKEVEDLVIFPSIDHLKTDGDDYDRLQYSLEDGTEDVKILRQHRQNTVSSEKAPAPGRAKSKVELRTCPVCNRIFDRPSFMTKHLQSKHGIDPTAKCDICGKGFANKDTLALHQTFHCRAQNPEDNYGDRTDAASMKLGTKEHASGATVECKLEKPKKINTLGSNLRKYRKAGRKKSSIKSRTCQVCHRIFDRPSQMIRHLNTLHHTKGPFTCNICKMKFTRKDYFYIHKKTHSIDKDKDKIYHVSKEVTDIEVDSGKQEGHRLRKRVNYKEIDGGSDDEVLIKSEAFSYSDGWDDSSSNNDSDDNYSDEKTHPKGKRRVKKSPKLQKRKYIRRVPKADRGGRPKSSIEDRTCPICKLVFPKPSSMAVHLNVKHERKPLYNCEVCQKGFAMKAYLDSHMWVHMSEEERLKRCTSIRQKRIQNKKPTKSPLEDRTCPVCKLILATPSKMAMHLNVKHERKILFTCEVCKRGFYRKDTFQGHLRTHLTPEERMTLLTTGALPNRPMDSLKISPTEPSNTERNAEESSTEGKTTAPSVKLKETRMSDVDARTCKVCQKIFDKPSRMQRHLNSVHTKAETYICEVCGKKFTWKDTLKKHMKYHDDESFISGAKDYLCSLCGISFRHKWSYERHNLCKHEQGGSNSKCFTCEMCGKSFKIKSLLVQHMKSKSHGGVGIKTSISKNDSDASLTIGSVTPGRKRTRKNLDLHPNKSLPLEPHNTVADDTHLSGISSVAGCSSSIGNADTDLSQHSHSNQDFNPIPNPSQAPQHQLGQHLGGAGPSHHHPHQQYQQTNVHPYHQLLAHQHLQGYSNAFNFVQSSLQLDHNNSHSHQNQ